MKPPMQTELQAPPGIWAPIAPSSVLTSRNVVPAPKRARDRCERSCCVSRRRSITIASSSTEYPAVLCPPERQTMGHPPALAIAIAILTSSASPQIAIRLG